MAIEECLDYIEDVNRTVNWTKEQDTDRQFFESIADLLEELKEKRKLFDFLFDTINPNDMEDYMRIYNAIGEKVSD